MSVLSEIARITQARNDIREELASEPFNIVFDESNLKIDELAEKLNFSSNYNPPDETLSSKYLTFCAITDSKFKFTKSGLKYSLDGTTWVDLPADTETPNVAPGNAIYFKGSLESEPYLNYSELKSMDNVINAGLPFNAGPGTFSATGYFNARGPVASIYLNDGASITSTSLMNNSAADGYQFAQLFFNCRKLVHAHDLVLPMLNGNTANTNNSVCAYAFMFANCTNLLSGPTLPDYHSLSTYYYGCYYMFAHMFDGCVALKDVSDMILPSRNREFCFCYMFKNCKSLPTPPVMNSAYINTHGYNATFAYPANYEYYGMFSGCLSLTSVFDIKRGGDYSYQSSAHCCGYMYQNCISLVDASDALKNGQPGVNHTGTTTAGGTGAFEHMFEGCDHLVTAPAMNCKFMAASICQAMFKACSSLTTLPSNMIQFSSGWYETGTSQSPSGVFTQMFYQCTSLVTPPAFPSGMRVGNASFDSTFRDCWSLASTPTYLPEPGVAEYDKTALYKKTFMNCTSLTTISFQSLNIGKGNANTFESMFQGCTSLTSIPSFTLTSLSSSTCRGMFRDCTSLTSIPTDLLSTTTTVTSGATYSCADMFRGCTSLTNTPNVLPITSLGSYIYSYMFDGCTSLTSIPSGLLPATTLGNDCYEYMFQGCTSLTSVPSGLLPATTCKQYCYQRMFKDCTNLTTVPADLLPATTLATGCYAYMFDGDRKLDTAPDLPAATVQYQSYMGLFQGCWMLHYVKALCTSGMSATNCNSWLNLAGSSYSGTKTFVCKTGASWPSGDSGIPSGWIVQREK